MADWERPTHDKERVICFILRLPCQSRLETPSQRFQTMFDPISGSTLWPSQLIIMPYLVCISQTALQSIQLWPHFFSLSFLFLSLLFSHQAIVGSMSYGSVFLPYSYPLQTPVHPLRISLYMSFPSQRSFGLPSQMQLLLFCMHSTLCDSQSHK